MIKMNSSFTNGGHDKAVTLIEKPPLFAFCMKPRGLEVPNKGSKQRSTHRKVSLSGHHSHIGFGYQDGYHNYGTFFHPSLKFVKKKKLKKLKILISQP